MKKISCEELLTFDEEKYWALRRDATQSRLDGKPAYCCEKCGYGVYAPKSGFDSRPFWKHFQGAPTTCPWYTGDTSTLDEVSARQFQGAQESPLHYRIKTEIGDILSKQEAVTNVVVDEYLAGKEGMRRPDVRFTYRNIDVAIEIQLSHTQIPIILQREAFYAANNRHLLWMTWNFEQRPLNSVRQSFLDIYYSQNKNVFSLDEACVEVAHKENELIFLALQERNGSWISEKSRLSDITWPLAGLPFVINALADFRKRWINAWLQATDKFGTKQASRIELLDELIRTTNTPIAVDELERIEFDHLLNCLLSFGFNKIVGSRQKKLIEVVNTYLNYQLKHRHPFAALVKTAALASGREDILTIDSAKSKFEYCMRTSEQEPPGGPVGRLIMALFPNWYIYKASQNASSGNSIVEALPA